MSVECLSPERIGPSGLARLEALEPRLSSTLSDVPRRHAASLHVPGTTHSLKCMDQAIWAEELARKLLEIPAAAPLGARPGGGRASPDLGPHPG